MQVASPYVSRAAVGRPRFVLIAASVTQTKGIAMTTLSSVLREFGCTRSAYEYWSAKKYLKTKFHETTQGASREASRDNAIEVSLMTALTKAGIHPYDAQTVTRDLLKEIRAVRI
jgi:hypothetical protein